MRVAVAIGSRANWGSLRSACIALRRHDADVRPVLFASALVERYGDVFASLARDGFTDAEGLSCHTEGHVTDMARTAGLAAVEWSTYIRNARPDAVLVVGDRHEVLGAAMAAAYANVRLVHTMGGEVSGSIDDKVRDAITCLADAHCVASRGAMRRVEELMKVGTMAHLTGCPRVDTVREAIGSETRRAYERTIMVSQHPVTTEDGSYGDMAETLQAVGTVAERRNFGVELFWPNADAGTGGSARAIRSWLASEQAENLQVRTHRTMGPEDYARMMARAACLVGNSSSGLREGAWIGTPVVNVGTRQSNREHGANVVDVPAFADQIESAIVRQIDHGAYPSSDMYGDGTAGERVAKMVLG